MINSTLTSISLETNLIKQLTLIAIELHRPANDLANEAVRLYIKDLEHRKLENEKLADLWLDNYDFGE